MPVTLRTSPARTSIFPPNVDVHALNRARAQRRMAESVDTRLQLVRLLENSNGKLVSAFMNMDETQIRTLVGRMSRLSTEDLSTFSDDQLQRIVSRFLCLGWTCRVVKDPQYQDMSYHDFNAFCRKLPASAKALLGWRDIPAAPYAHGVRADFIGFPHVQQGADNLCTVHSLNSCLPDHISYNADMLDKLAHSFAEQTGKRPEFYFSRTQGLGPEFQNSLLQRHGFIVFDKEDLEGDAVESWLNRMMATRCIIESTEVGAQFPNGMIARAPHQAAIRKDSAGRWWLLNGMDPVATPVDFANFQTGKFRFKALVARFSE